jgi:hypothetical protein
VKGCGSTNLTSAFRVDNALGTSLFFVSDAKNIGMGTTTPSFKLELSGTSNTADRTIAINTVPMLYLPDQTSTVFIGSAAFGNGLRNLNRTTASEGQSVTAVGIDALLSNTTGFQNTALGYRAGYFTTTGYNNVAIGAYALNSNITGTNNIAIGEEVMYSGSGDFNIAIGTSALRATTGSYNVAIGYNSLRTNGSGSQNTGVGLNTLFSSTTGSYNTAVGCQSLYTNSSGSSNTGIGQSALQGNTSGSDNTGIGSNALFTNQTGSGNTGIGSQALYSNTNGPANFACGKNAMYYNTTGGYNSATGTEVLQNNVSGASNTAHGYRALFNVTTSNNTAVGTSSLYQCNSGANNTALGYRAGYDNTSGSNNIAIGYFPSSGAGTPVHITTGSNNIIIGNDVYKGITPTASNQLNIGNLIYGSNLNSGNIISTGNIGIGTTIPQRRLVVSSSGAEGVELHPFSGYSQIIGYNRSTSAYIPLILQDAAGGNVGVGVNTPSSKLETGGSFGAKVRGINNDYTAADETVIMANATGGPILITLPAASTATNRIYMIKRTDNSLYACNIGTPGYSTGTNTEKIEGSLAAKSLGYLQSVTLVCDGSNWYILD